MSRTPKLWGCEELIHASEEYWMKKLAWNANVASSFHYHQTKDETWHVLKGVARVLLMPIKEKAPRIRSPFAIPNTEIPELLEKGEIFLDLLSEGDTLHISPYMAHQVISGDAGFVVLEASTKHTDEDVIRLIPSMQNTPDYVR